MGMQNLDHAPVSFAGAAWYVITTNPGCQTRAQLGLAAAGYRTFLAQYTAWVTHARIRKMKRKPLLNRYLFVEVDPNQQSFETIRQTNGVESILTISGVPMAVPSLWVEELISRQLRGEFDYASQGPLPQYAIVEVVEGINESLRGVLLSIGRKGANVKLFGQKSAVLVSQMAVRAVPC
jgi:transcription antitermination factor NusG